MPLTADLLTQQLELADALLAGRTRMLEPQDLPGGYGRVVHALDQVLRACDCEAVVGGGWAVWRHGYVGRVTQDIDIALPGDKLDEFLKTAAVSGFDVLTSAAGPSSNPKAPASTLTSFTKAADPASPRVRRRRRSPILARWALHAAR